MPWCPKCQNEFIDGVTHCNDCGEPLVPNLQATEMEMMDIDPLEIESSSSIDADFNPRHPQNPLDPLNSPLATFIRPSDSPLYMKAADRKEEYSSSSFSFLIVALITFTIGMLIFFNKFNLSNQPEARIKYLFILFSISLIFIVLAFFSNRKSKILAKSVDKEEQQLKLISDYFKQQLDTPSESDYLSMDELYFARNEWILQKLHAYDSDFSDSYCDYLSELLYQELFEA